MTPALHWSQKYGCICGMTFRSYAADAFHRHNFPALCRSAKPKRTKAASSSAQPTHVLVGAIVQEPNQ